jgi:hypothetical protein
MLAVESLDPRTRQDPRRLLGEPLTHEAGVISHDKPFMILPLRGDMVGNRLNDISYRLEGEIFTQDASPSRSAKSYVLHVPSSPKYRITTSLLSLIYQKYRVKGKGLFRGIFLIDIFLLKLIQLTNT